jgi:TolB-like protein/DNA-binding winged helix-turn-helix (wHTH) protein
MPHHNSHFYEFGPYRLDVGQRVLTRTGEAISLTPKATEVLTLLVANAGQLVAKDELLRRVWPDTFVEESNLTQNIFLLRRVLGDERPSPRYIETVVRRGYRFIANVRVVGGPAGEAVDAAALRDPRYGGDLRSAGDANSSPGLSREVGFPTGDGPSPQTPYSHTTSDSGHAGDRIAAVDPRHPRYLASGLFGADDSAAPQTVAVLPFLNATGNDDVEYLADGLTDNIVNNLSRVSKLRVMSRSAVFRYKVKKEVDPRTIGRELGVGVVLVGKLTSRSEGLIIIVELVEVLSGWQLWGDSFDCQLKDILEIQDLITRKVLSALKLNLTGDEEKRITARYTESAEAYQSYLEARYHWSTYTRQGMEKAILHFRHAIELDPNYALAYEGIIDCYLRLATNYLPPEQDLFNPAGEWASRTSAQMPSTNRVTNRDNDRLQLPDDADPRLKVRFEWDWRVAERELHRAHDLRSDYPAAHQWYAAYRLARDLFQQSTGCTDTGTLIERWRLPTQILSGEPSSAEQLQVLCAIARGQIAVCNYDAAELILKPFFPKSDWPRLSALTTPAAADLLFTLGILIASVATTKQTTNSYRRAAAFLNGSIALFEHLELKARSVEARAELARCYYRQGLFDIARETLLAAVDELPDDQLEIRCRCLIYWGMLERDAGRLTEAMSKLRDAALVVTPVGPLVSVRYHLEIAGTLRDLAVSEKKEIYSQEADSHFRAGLYESQAIGDHRTTATIENNFGLFLLNLKAWEESEQHLLRSHRYFESLLDKFRGAQVNETLTRLYLLTNRFRSAEIAIEACIQTLESTDSEAVLCEALTTGGIVSSKLGKQGEAKNRFEAAYKIAERCGDREGGRRALVSLFEASKDHLSADELRQLLHRLVKLCSMTEGSTLARRVEETIGEVQATIDGGSRKF